MQSRTRVEFPPFRLDLTNHELWRGETKLTLRPKPFALLAYLATHPHRLVTHAELGKALWPDTHVGDGLLRGYVRDVRSVLDDDPAAPRYVETVARLGYRFVAPLAAAPRPASCALTPPPPAHLVGREPALQTLDAHLARALDGERQLVFVTGEPGIGKTALVDAFVARVGRRAWSAHGQCVEHFGPGEAYLPLLEWLGRLGRMGLRDDLTEALTRHAPTWMLQVPNLVADADAEALRRRTQGATRERMLREFVEAVDALAAVCPLVIVLEDIQWSDPSTLDLVTAVAKRREPARLLMLCTYRPSEVGDDHPLAAIARELRVHGRSHELALPPLSVAGVRDYLARRLESRQGLDAAAAAVHAVTDGNPLFVGNCVDDWLARGVLVEHDAQWRVDERDGPVPDGVRQMIEHRLGRLAPAARRVLEAAAVVGREFSSAAVAAALDESQDGIEAACDELGSVLRPFGVDDAGDDVAGRYRFVHALHRQVLYGGLGEARRVRLHRRVGEWAVRCWGEHATEHAAELAVHFERGHDERAVPYLEAAARNALGKHAYGEAASAVQRALMLLAGRPDGAERDLRELSLQTMLGTAAVTTKGYAAPEVEQAFARARELARRVDAGPELAFVYAGLFRFAFARARFVEAGEIGARALQLATAHAPALRAVAHCMIGPPLVSLAELVRGREHLERAVALVDAEQSRAIGRAHGDDPALTALAFLAIVLWLQGYPDQALARCREAQALAEQLATPYGLAFSQSFTAWIQVRRGDVEAARGSSEALASLAAVEGYGFFRAEAVIFRGWALAADGDGEGIEQIRAGLAAHRSAGVEMGRPSHLALLAEACLGTGRVDDGLAAVDEALALVGVTSERCYEADLHRLRGELLWKRSGGRRGAAARRAEEALRRALAVAQGQGAKALELRAAIALDRLGRLQTDPLHARRALEEVVAWFAEGVDTADLRVARELLGTRR